MDEAVRSIIERIQSSAAVKSVFGEVVTAHGRTIIPVARIVYGFGGGSGTRAGDRPEGGGGGGGGVVALPLGVVELAEGQTRFIALDEHRRFAAACLLGLCAGFVWARFLYRSRK